MLKDWSVALSSAVNRELCEHLIRADGQEDLTFAFWNPSYGSTRETALVEAVIPPLDWDREVHGNVSFMPVYLERVCSEAMRRNSGIAFLHSHPFPGWQGMSNDDVIAEQKMAPAVQSLTGLPLVGMTIGSDGAWSARVWRHKSGRTYERQWCSRVRVVGEQLTVHNAPRSTRPPLFREMFKRTVAMWGAKGHADLASLRIGVVGLGSVGSLVAESLARMGCQDIVLIDFDKVEAHNLDRLVTAVETDIGRTKTAITAARLQFVRTAEELVVRTIESSVAEEDGYRAALDCDVLFSCVDRPRARHILNHFAYAHLIPVIDGGIMARFRRDKFAGADWQVQTVGPGKCCLECLTAYDPSDVSTEVAGKLDDPSYLAGLPFDHRFKRNENVFPFSMNLASLEVLQLVALVTGAAGVTSFGVQRFRYVPGITELLPNRVCKAGCDTSKEIAVGDKYFTLMGRDLSAERSRASGEDPSGPRREVVKR